MTIKQRLFIIFQYVIPHHLLSRLIGRLAQCRVKCIKNTLIRWFISHYQVDMAQAEYESYYEYENFNDFFTRALKQGMRPINDALDVIVSPVDGVISEMGTITEGRILQAKGHDYGVADLLGGDSQKAAQFSGGEFATIYLSPRDYHRIHMPVAGTLKEMTYVPGRLFSVNQTTAEHVPNLFARNERVVCLFDTEFGEMAVILVGAMIVASIETTWSGLVTPPTRELKTFRYDESARQAIYLEKGAELGRFKLGSTVIVMFKQNNISWKEMLKINDVLTVGAEIAHKI